MVKSHRTRGDEIIARGSLYIKMLNRKWRFVVDERKEKKGEQGYCQYYPLEQSVRTRTHTLSLLLSMGFGRLR